MQNSINTRWILTFIESAVSKNNLTTSKTTSKTKNSSKTTCCGWGARCGQPEKVIPWQPAERRSTPKWTMDYHIFGLIKSKSHYKTELSIRHSIQWFFDSFFLVMSRERVCQFPKIFGLSFNSQTVCLLSIWLGIHTSSDTNLVQTGPWWTWINIFNIYIYIHLLVLLVKSAKPSKFSPPVLVFSFFDNLPLVFWPFSQFLPSTLPTSSPHI